MGLYEVYSTDYIFDEGDIIDYEWIREEFMRDNRWYEAIVEDFEPYNTHITFCIKYGTPDVIQEITDCIYEKYGIYCTYKEV